MLERQTRETPPGATDVTKMAYGYNELIIDAWPVEDWEALLPHSVVAFFVQPLATPEEKQRARSAHRLYVTDRQLLEKSREVVSRTPLVLYDPRANSAPFRLWDS